MNYFTMKNTEGFTQSQISELNRRLAEKLSDYEEEDIDYAQIVKYYSDIVNDEWTELDSKMF